MRWNFSCSPERQALIAEALSGKDGDAEQALAELVAELGLPRRLQDVGVTRDAFSAIAKRAMGDILIKSNPRPVKTSHDIEEILEMAW